MDIRRDVLGILVGGSPAPGINGVISAATIEAINSNLIVMGFLHGWKLLKYGQSSTSILEVSDMTTIHTKGGSFLRTSKQQLKTKIEVENALQVIQHHRVRYLLTIGGVETAHSSSLLSAAADKQGYQLSVVHVPKTIFSDLMLPQNAKTFGFSTAKEFGSRVIGNLDEDARTMDRFYIVSVIGSKAGHLCLGIGKSAATTLTLIPEEFDYPVKFSDIVDHVDACMIKREAMGKRYGVILLTEGLVDKMEQKEIEKRFGSVDEGHEELSRAVAQEVLSRMKERNKPVPRIIARDLGFELRAGDPNATDRELSRDLGYGALHDLVKGGTGHMVTMQGADMISIPFADLIDPKTGKPHLRTVDTASLGFKVAQKYMVRLVRSDLESPEILFGLAKAAKMTATEFAERFAHIV